jgi:hypothetical protein
MRSQAIVEQIDVMRVPGYGFEPTLETGRPINLESPSNFVEHPPREQIGILVVINQENFYRGILRYSVQG